MINLDLLSKTQKQFLLKHRWDFCHFQAGPELQPGEKQDLIDRNVLCYDREYSSFFRLTKHGKHIARHLKMNKLTGAITFQENSVMKKIIFGAVLAIVGLSGMGFGTGAFSYVSTAWNQAAEAIQEEIPVEFQIERAKNLIMKLDPEMKSTLVKTAKKEIELEDINERIAVISEKVDESEQTLMATDEISDKTRIMYVSHKTNQSTLTSLHQLASLKLQTVEAGKKKLLQLSQARTALALTIEELEVRNETLKLLQNEAGTFENSAVLSEVNNIVKGLKTRIGVAEKLLDIQGTLNEKAGSDTSLDTEIADFITGNKPESQIAHNEL